MDYRLNSFFRVLTLVVPVAAASCMSLNDYDRPAGDVGAIGFNLSMPDDMQSKALNYKIVGAGSYQKIGTIPFAADTRSFSALITGIPRATGYQLTLTSSDDAKVHCEGTAGFDIVTAGVTTNLTVRLQCRHVVKQPETDAGIPPIVEDDAGTGGVDVGGDINLCPEIDGLYTWRENDGSIELSSSACDPDSMPLPLSYKWSVSGGKLSATTEEIVHFFCPEAGGTVQVTLEVSDGLCTDKFVQPVDCKCDTNKSDQHDTDDQGDDDDDQHEDGKHSWGGRD